MTNHLRELGASLRHLIETLPPEQAERLRQHAQLQAIDDFIQHSPALLNALPGADAAHSAQAIRQALTSPRALALVLSAISTGLKTAAWYGQTVIPDERLLAPGNGPVSPALREAAHAAIKTSLSWAIALLEYIPLTISNRVADRHGIDLTSLKGAVTAMDLAWFVGFLKVSKQSPLTWHHYLGLAIATGGCAILNKPASLLAGLDARMDAAQTRLGNAIHCGAADLETQVQTSTRQVLLRRDDADRLLRMDMLIQQELPAAAACVRELLPEAARSDFDEAVATTASEVDLDEIAIDHQLQAQMARLDALMQSGPAMSAALTAIRGELDELSRQQLSLRRKCFAGAWLVAQTVLAVTSGVMLARQHSLAAALALSASATGVKTIAWYAHTVIPDDKLPTAQSHQELASTAVKIAISWGIALFEYIPLTLANRQADRDGINLAKVRGAIEAMDMLWLIAFMQMVKGERVQWHHLMGLAVAGVGVAIANAG